MIIKEITLTNSTNSNRVIIKSKSFGLEVVKWVGTEYYNELAIHKTEDNTMLWQAASEIYTHINGTTGTNSDVREYFELVERMLGL